MLPPAKTVPALRTKLRALLRTDSMAALSRRLGKSPGYLSRLLARTDDGWLEAGEIVFVERYFGLGAGELVPWTQEE